MDGSKMPKRIEMVYRDALDNISFTKKQEWIVAGYALTVHAAGIAIWKQFAHSICLQGLLTVTTILAAIYGIAVLFGFAQGLKKWRGRLDWIYEHYFEGQERIGLKLGQRPKRTEWVFLGGLSLTLLFSAAVILFAIWS